MKQQRHGIVAVMFLAACALAQTSEKDNRVEITVRNDYRYITANGIPNHRHGDFPNRGNPNSIRAQSYTFRMPAQPQLVKTITLLGMNPFGVAINGVPFDPGAAEWWNNDPGSGWQYEALSGKINLGMDQNHAHVQPNGAYHYHGLPTGLINQLGDEKRMTLIGYAADGFPIYEQYGYRLADIRTDILKLRSSYRLKAGKRPGGPEGKYDGTFVQDYEYVAGAGDLDQCNGRNGVTPEYLDGTYYYVITSEFPFIPRCYRGTPDESFRRRGPGPGGPRGRPPGGRPADQ
ncbi:MAG TPA: YHYH protein [Pyrinomonadaceae bacterium]|jgi:hypothetical protein|nr:YHYH protein [Pyrinomonadaceae bacterium]